MTHWTTRLFISVSLFLNLLEESASFAPASFAGTGLRQQQQQQQQQQLTVLEMATGGGKKKRRRRKDRKQPPGATAPDPIKVSLEKIEGEEDNDEDDDDDSSISTTAPVEDIVGFDLKPDDIAKGTTVLPDIKDSQKMKKETTEEDLSLLKDVAQFQFKSDDILKGVKDEEKAADPVQAEDSSAIPLPNIQEARKKKEMEQEVARMEEEKAMNRPKIKRSDKEAFTRLLEQQPFADADDSFFEEEAYTTVSALLGEGAKPFLNIPSGPLQVGHFTGALGIVLMAYVEYPGFPLTNLPTAIRDALQGGLATVYAINTVLAILAAFKAKERGQPIPLWVAKTFSVGGLAYDQLTQLPTLEQIEKAKSVKGARALKSKKR